MFFLPRYIKDAITQRESVRTY